MPQKMTEKPMKDMLNTCLLMTFEHMKENVLIKRPEMKSEFDLFDKTLYIWAFRKQP